MSQSSGTETAAGVFSALKPQPADALLAVLAECRADPRAAKIDLTVGMYRDESGITPVMRSIKAAERWLLETQDSKGYLSPEGDLAFVNLIRPILFGPAFASSDRICGVQTPGGTGAVRLAGDLVTATGAKSTLWLGVPAWGNYRPLFSASRLNVETYNAFDVATQTLRFDETMRALTSARAGDVIVLQASCNNPTGADFTAAQWKEIAVTLASRRLLPLLDAAYQGLGDGMEEDVAGLRVVLDHVDEALVAYSCDKNFGVYRDRVGALYAVSKSAAAATTVFSNLVSLARANWSMPSDHGAAAIRHILETPALAADWRAELDTMRTRVNANRQRLAASGSASTCAARPEPKYSTCSIRNGPICPAATRARASRIIG
jgi:aromatic-amino-acid transaminase